ncbi:hypothetical protein SAMN05443247_00029 [Bradyrhizobium erythrophlei]|nr:hypothetical protein SAMN05443247_00029 [Bradyrhizobium erythrophlei]
MITGMEVGALFRLVDEVSPGLRKILESVRELNKAITLARDNLKGLGAAPGLGAAIAETDSLAAAWRKVGESAAAAAKVVASSAASSARSAAAAATSGATAAVGRGGGFRPGVGGAASYLPGHVTGPSIPLPGKSHLNLGGTPAMVGAGIAGLSLYEAANMETDVHWLNYHLGRKDSTEANAQSQKLIEDTMKGTGLGLSEVGKSVTDIARIMRDTPGFDVVKESPRILRAALTEALSKGTTLDESVKSILGMTHMVQAYKPGEMEKLYQVFAYLSTANPAPLSQMEKTYSYAIPILRSGADIDPKEAMLLSTVLSTSGVTSSKAGTWLREFGVRAMPGNKEHNETLKQLGLLDENGKPTWFVNGKPSLVKALEIAGPIAAAMPPERRLATEMDLFGRRGGGGFAVLGGETSLERYRQMRAGMDDQGNINRYNTILSDTMGTSKMVARTTLQEFNVALIDLGGKALPAAIAGVKGLSTALGWFTGGHRTPEDKTFKPSWLENLHDYLSPGNWLGKGVSALPKQEPLLPPPPAGAPTKSWWQFGGGGGDDGTAPDKTNFLQGPTAPPKVTLAPTLSLSLNIDGQMLAHAVSDAFGNNTGFVTQAPAADGLGQHNSGDHNFGDR